MQGLYNQIAGLIFSFLFILLREKVASMPPNQNFSWLSNEWSMIKDNYSKIRSSCQPKTERERKILAAICKIKKSGRKAFTELGNFPLGTPGGRIENIHIMQ